MQKKHNQYETVFSPDLCYMSPVYSAVIGSKKNWKAKYKQPDKNNYQVLETSETTLYQIKTAHSA